MADDTQEIAQAWKGFDETRRKTLLGKMTPEQKKNLRTALEGAPSTPDVAKLTVNTINPKTGKGYGLYRMLPSSQQGYTDTSQQVEVPYNQVQAAIGAGLQLHFDETQRWEQDYTHEGKSPSLIEKANTKIQSLLTPEENTGVKPARSDINNAARAAGRVVYGTPEYLGNVLSAASDFAMGRSNGNDLMDLIDPTKLPENLYKQFQGDWQHDHRLAVQNLVGSLVGMGIVAKATRGATKAVESIPKPKVGEYVRGGIRDTLGVTENTEKTVAKYGKDTEAAKAQNITATERTLKDRGKVETTNQTAAQRHADALKQHQDATKAVQAQNVKALQDHIETAGKIVKDNQAAEDAIKARHTGEQQVEQETAEFRKRIDDAKTKAETDNKVAWDDVRAKTAGHSTDISNLQQIAERAAEQADPATSALFKRIIKGEQPTLPTLTRTSTAVKYIDSAGNAVDRQAMSPVSFDQKVASGEFKTAPITETVTPDDPGYGDLYERQFGEPPPVGGGPAQFNRLQRWYSYISNKMYGGGRVEGGLYNSYKVVRDAINDAMQDIAKQANATAELEKARKLHTEKMEAFSDSPNEPATVASAYEKKIVPESVKETTEAEWGKKLERYDPQITRLAESITRAKEGLKKLPSEEEARRMVKPIPAPPDSAPLPEKPVAPPPVPYAEPHANQPLPKAPNIQAENLKFINEGLRRYGKVGGWVLRTIVGGAELGLSHGDLSVFGENMLLGQAAVTVLTRALRSPSMLDWLARPLVEDIKVISTLPPAEAMRMREAIKALADEENRVDPSKAKIKIAPAMAAFLAGKSAAQQGSKKDPLTDVKQKADDLQNDFHKSGFSPAPAETTPPPAVVTPPPAESTTPDFDVEPQSSNKITHRFNPETGKIEAA